MQTQIKTTLLLVAAMTIFACRKKIGSDAPAVPDGDITNTQTQVAALTKEVMDALEQVYRSNAACNEVNAAILSGYYEDERVLLKDLLFPHLSDLYKSENFRKIKTDTGIFRKKFCEIILKERYPLLAAELGPALNGKVQHMPAILSNDARIPQNNVAVLSGSQQVAIYFPYSENFGNIIISDLIPDGNKLAIIKKPTLVYTDRESDTTTGLAPYYCQGSPGNVCYGTVTVDDKYAEIKPTHIVTVGAIIKEASAVVPKTELVTRIYHGSSKLTRQMDKLISFTGNGGGSEIKVCRINGYLKRSDEQITDFAGDVVTLQYTRSDISKKRWKRVFSVWDPNWNYQDIEQIYAVYEDDNRGTSTIDGSLRTTITLPAKLGKGEGDLGFKIQVMSQDDIITQRKLDRKSFLRDGLNNQGWGYLQDPNDFLTVNGDWPIFDGGSIWQYTIPYRIY